MEEAKSQSKLIAKIEELAEMPYDDIVWIYKDKDNEYEITDKSLEQVIFDLEHNYTAIPF